MYAGVLRRELAERNRLWARGRLHAESFGGDPVIVYAPEHPNDEDLSLGTPPEHPNDEDLSLGTPPEHPNDEDLSLGTPPERAEAGEARHGNFYDPAYAAILRRPEWLRRFNKVHAQGRRALPRLECNPKRKWRELDSCMSSDALLMNVFCTPGVTESAAVRGALGLEDGVTPEFGWKARVPLKSGLLDRTEVDMRLGSLLVEAKLTESDFQTRKAEVVEAYRDFDQVFDRDLLPRVGIAVGRRKSEREFPEEYSQEFEPAVADETRVERWVEAPVEGGYAGYQLIRNVLAAYATGARFCVIHDERRPDLREAWFRVMAAVRTAELRTRLLVLTWQELAGMVPEGLREFLGAKYGIRE
jgi:hypothetical protein